MGTVAVRMPLHPVALDLLRRTGPMAVSSANLHSEPAATSADEAQQQLGDSVSVYLDGGQCADNVPSTILDLTGTVPRMLRAGAISVDALRKVVPVIDLPANPAIVEEELSPADRRAAESIAAANAAGTVEPGEPAESAGRRGHAEPRRAPTRYPIRDRAPDRPPPCASISTS